MKTYTVILYSVPDGARVLEWQDARTPTDAVRAVVNKRMLKATDIEVIAVLPGKLRAEDVDEYTQFPAA